MRERKVEPLAEVLRRVVRTLEIERELTAHSVEPVWEVGSPGTELEFAL